METELPLWGEAEQWSWGTGRPETGVARDSSRGVSSRRQSGREEHCILKVYAQGRSEYKPKLCFKEEKCILLNMLQTKGNLILLMDKSERVGDRRYSQEKTLKAADNRLGTANRVLLGCCFCGLGYNALSATKEYWIKLPFIVLIRTGRDIKLMPRCHRDLCLAPSDDWRQEASLRFLEKNKCKRKQI